MADTTVIYYTSNREVESFEQEIIKNLLVAADGLPIISVSHKPISLGKNICVGDVGISNHNIRRQTQIGAMEASTKYIALAESDCLYPKEYFRSIPPRKDKLYACDSLYMLFHNRDGYYKKAYSECAIVASRDCLLDKLDGILNGKSMWVPTIELRYKGAKFLRKPRFRFFHTEIPVINMKTKRNMHKQTWLSDDMPIYDLPHWGNAIELRKAFLLSKK